MTAHASLLVRLNKGTTLQAREDFIEKARELGAAYPASELNLILLTWEEDNLWKLAALYVQARDELNDWNHYGEELLPPLDEAIPGSDDTDLSKLHVWQDSNPVEVVPLRLRQWLDGLRVQGYQPMYNGRPSCPGCSNFVDEEETHKPGCITLAYPL